MAKDTTIDDWRACFSSDAGRRVLAEILYMGGYFSTDLGTIEDLAVLNFVKVIMSKCGFMKPTVIEMHVNSLFQIPMGAK